MLPPGDLRMALAALCGDDEWGETWASVLQHRFAGTGEMRGHVVGNLLIVSLWEQLGDHVAALDWVGRLLGARGRVLPMALTPLDITAEVSGLDPAIPSGLTTVRGQVAVATAARHHRVDLAAPRRAAAVPRGGRRRARRRPGGARPGLVVHLRAAPPDGPVAAPRPSIETHGHLVVVLNLAPQDGETEGYAAADHLARPPRPRPRPAARHRPGRPRPATVGGTCRARGPGRQVRRPASSSPTSPATTAPRGTTRRSSPRRTPRSWRL